MSSPVTPRDSLHANVLFTPRKDVAKIALSSISAEQVDTLIADMQRALHNLEKMQGLADTSGGLMRLRSAEVHMLGQIELAHDLMQEALACGRRETLFELFCGDDRAKGTRASKISAVLEQVHFSPMFHDDQRLPSCRSACCSVEGVLHDALLGRTSRAARASRVFAERLHKEREERDRLATLEAERLARLRLTEEAQKQRWAASRQEAFRKIMEGTVQQHAEKMPCPEAGGQQAAVPGTGKGGPPREEGAGQQEAAVQEGAMASATTGAVNAEAGSHVEEASPDDEPGAPLPALGDEFLKKDSEAFLIRRGDDAAPAIIKRQCGGACYTQ